MINSLRVHSAPAPEPSAPPKAPDDYLARLVKLVPAEVIALYITVKDTFNGKPEALCTWGLVCVFLVILVRSIATKSGGAMLSLRGVQILAVFVATISFIVWVLATGNPIGWGKNWFGWITYPAAVAGVWTFLIPYIYKGDSQ